MTGSENEVRLQLKGGRTIKIVRTETPTGGMWSIPEMPEIAAHQNISVIRDRLRGKGLIASRPGSPDTFAVDGKDEMAEQTEFRVGQSVKVLQGNKVVQGVIIKKRISIDGEEEYMVELPSQIHRGRIGLENVNRRRILASRPGSPDTMSVEDRFYFGKGRKERFAEPREIEAKIRAWIDSRGLPIGLQETNALSYIAAQHMLRGGVSVEQAVKSAARRHAQIGLASAGLRTWLEENA